MWLWLQSNYRPYQYQKMMQGMFKYNTSDASFTNPWPEFFQVFHLLLWLIVCKCLTCVRIFITGKWKFLKTVKRCNSQLPCQFFETLNIYIVPYNENVENFCSYLLDCLIRLYLCFTNKKQWKGFKPNKSWRSFTVCDNI